MSHDHSAMGSMSMGGLPPLIEFPKFYWAAVGSVVATATLVNIHNFVLYRQRLSAAHTGRPKPAKPKSWFFLWNATLYALMREASNFSIRIPARHRTFRLPTVGRSFLIVANLVVLIVLCLYGFDLGDRWSREQIGFRCGFVTIAQLPLIFLLAGKNNIIGHLTGVSHERLNWLHRWCARCMLFTATLHMGYFFADWAPYNYIGTQLRQNTIVWKGIAAWAMLVWIVFSSMTPIRGWCYELFVVQHLISFAVFIGFVYIHTPAEVHIYVWIPVALFWFDRVIRVLRLLYANVSLFHRRQKRGDNALGLWACKADFTPLPHDTTRIVIHNPPISWAPGQHLFLSCHSIVPLQSHPFTIASIPEDGKLEFLVKAETGGTKRFFRHAQKMHGLPAKSRASCTKTVTIEGPYGCLRPLRQFDSVVLLAGSTGATFTLPLLRDILQGWEENASPARNKTSFLGRQIGAVTRHVRFAWVVKSRGQLGWLSIHLSSVWQKFQKLKESARDIKLELTIYLTCDDSFTAEHKTFLSAITAPNPNLNSEPKKFQEEHSEVSIRNRPVYQDETSKCAENEENVREMTRITSQSSDTIEARDLDQPCCCKTTVNESLSPATTPLRCSCGSNPISNTSLRLSSSTSSARSPGPDPLLHPSIVAYSGRPDLKAIIRRSLEQAVGESAVVVCGPQGLVADAKHAVCSLSDERAVHKGTGAQGIYIHTESFGY